MSDLILDADVKVGGTAELKSFASALSAVNDSLRELVQSSKAITTAFNATEKAVAGVKSGSRAANREVVSLTTALTAQAAAQKSLSSFKVTDNRSSGTTAETVRAQAAERQRIENEALGRSYTFVDNRAAGSGQVAADAAAKGARGAEKHGAAVHKVGEAYKEAAAYAEKMQKFLAKQHTNINPDAGTSQYHNIRTSVDTFRGAQSDESTRKNQSIAASMEERARKEDAATKVIEATVQRRIRAYTEEEQAQRRAAVPTTALKASPGQQKIAQTAYKDEELKAMGAFYRQQEILTAAAAAHTEKKVQKTAAAFGAYNDKLANTRYALYDVSNTMGIAGAATLAFNAIVVKSAMDYETAMAQISRTSGTSGAALETLRGEFVELAQTVPVAFSDLSKIGTLAGQLNVPAEEIAAFTETVAKFSATTNVTAEASATAFGRLDALLPDVQGNYEALGSSILTVGINSVATEQEIISTSSQIAAAGAAAGFTADQVIGLSASFASLGIASESSRGTVVRVFGLMNKAIANGGAELEAYAKVAGVSSAEFSAAWGTDEFSDTFLKFLQGVEKDGSKAQLTLAGLGITASRDQNNILKLGQNFELVADNLAYANEGFSAGTQLGDAFAVQAATVASKIQTLVGSLQAYFATIGSSGLGPIGMLVDGLKNLVVVMTEMSNNPVIKWTAAVFGALTALSGIALIAGSGFGRLIASLIAFQPVKALVTSALAATTRELVIVSRAANVAGVSMNRLQIAATAASRAFVGLKGAIMSTGIGAIAILGIGAAIAGYESLQKSMRSAGQVAKDAFGDMSGLTTALKEDSKAHKEGAKSYGEVTGSLTTATEATTEWTGRLKDAENGQIAIAGVTYAAATAVDTNTLSIGKNTAAWLANKLATDEGVQGLLTKNAELGKADLPQLNVEGVLTAAAKNDTAAAKKIIEDYKASIGVDNGYSSNQIKQIFEVVKAAEEAAKLTTGALQEAANAAVVTGVVSEALGVTAQGAAGALNEEGAAADYAAEQLRALKAAIDGAFLNENAVAAFAGDFYTLSEAILGGNASMNAFDQTGQANLANLQTTIASSIAAGAALGIDASESVAIVFAQLQKQGVDTAVLLASLANMSIPGVSMTEVNGYVNGSDKMSSAGLELSNVLNKVAYSARPVPKAIKDSGSAAAEAAPKIRTLVDYASDLSSVFKRSFELRFGKQEAVDKVAKGWQAIADASAAADKKMRDAKATLQQLTADKAVEEYFLGIARQYGDTLRAGEISAGLAKINNDIADAKSEVSDATAGNSKTLVGNSQAAIDNRETITGLVSDYESQVAVLAASGLSADKLKTKTAALKAEFIRQATQLGFNKTEIKKYALAFDDVRVILGKLPRDVTVGFNGNPALQSIAEFMTKAKDKVKKGVGSVNIPVTVGKPAMPNLTPLGETAGQQWAKGFKRYANGVMKYPDGSYVKMGKNGERATVKFYKSGGYTGDGGTGQQAGIVHGKEFVIDAPNTARLGIPFLNALNNGAMPTSSAASASSKAGTGIMVVELSSYDRMLLAAAGNVQLSIGNKVVAQASNSANLVSAKRGSN